MARSTKVDWNNPEEVRAYHREVSKRWRLNNPDKFKEAKRRYRAKHHARLLQEESAYREANREKLRNKTREYHREHRERYRYYKIKRVHGLTRDDYEKLLAQQNGVCSICKKAPHEKQPFLDIDHDHVTEIRRGLLCHNCNVGLGNFQDRADLLRLAAAYLEAHAH